MTIGLIMLQTITHRGLSPTRLSPALGRLLLLLLLLAHRRDRQAPTRLIQDVSLLLLLRHAHSPALSRLLLLLLANTPAK